MQDICEDGHGARGCGDMQVVADTVRGRVVVQYASYSATLEDTPPFLNASGNWLPHHIVQISSTDMGASSCGRHCQARAPLPLPLSSGVNHHDKIVERVMAN